MSGWAKVFGIFLLLIAGCLLANGAVMIDLSNKGGIVVTSVEDAVGIDGVAIKIKTEEEKKMLTESRKLFIQAMSAINIIAGIFMLVLGVYYFLPDSSQQTAYAPVKYVKQKYFTSKPVSVVPEPAGIL